MSLSPYAPPLSPLANRGRRRRSPISLTPLVDVVFILLIFFMLASSFLDWRTIEMNAPARTSAGAAMEGALLVELRGDGLRLSGRPVSPAELKGRVRQRLGENPDQRILVRPAPGIDFQQTVTILDLLADAGARDLSLVPAPGIDTMHFERRQERNDEERILPLINVVFLLLIFFIIAGQLAATDPFEVEPVTSASEAPAQVPDLIVLAGSDGRLALNGQIMDEAELKSALAGHLGANGNEGAPPVRLKADRRAEAGRIIAVMEILREAGARKIRLLTVPDPL